MYHFQSLPKVKDVRRSLRTHNWKSYKDYGIASKTDIAIHHSLTTSGSAEAYANYHVGTHGWAGIGYHFVIEKDGTIKWCNDLGRKTFHVGNSNKFAIGICLTGDFRKGKQKPTEAQIASLYDLIVALKKDLPNYKRMRGHNEFDGYAWKNCPGDNWDYIKELIEEANKRREQQPSEPSKGISTQSESKPTTYTIQAGDTLWKISRDFGVSVDDIIEWNPSIKAKALQIGDQLVVSASEVKPSYNIVEVTGDVWLHSTPDFEKESRVRILYKGEVYKKYGEVNGMANLGNTFVSLNYVRDVK